MTNGEVVKATEAEVPRPKTSTPHPLLTEAVPIDDHCSGDRWAAQNEALLAKLVAIVAMGQAGHAANILKTLLPAPPSINNDDLRREAKVRLTVQDVVQKSRMGYPRWQRDGFIFQVISWIVARQNHGGLAFIKSPPVSATSQGLDGLMIELSDDKSTVIMTTVFEDKCTENPRNTFLEDVIPAFLDRHKGKRSVELIDTADALLRMAGIDDAAVAQLAAAVIDRNRRRYRAAFALTEERDSQQEREKLFKGYDALDDISKSQRVGASLIVSGAASRMVRCLGFAGHWLSG